MQGLENIIKDHIILQVLRLNVISTSHEGPINKAIFGSKMLPKGRQYCSTLHIPFQDWWIFSQDNFELWYDVS